MVDPKARLALEKGLSSLPLYAVAVTIFRMETRRHPPALEVLLYRPKWLEHAREWMLPETDLQAGSEIDESAERLVQELTSVSVVSATTVTTLPRGKPLNGAISICTASVGRGARIRRPPKGVDLRFCNFLNLPPMMLENYSKGIYQSLLALASNPRDVALLIQNDRFTVAELVSAVNVVRRMAGIDGEVDLRNFRRRLDEADWIEDTGTMSSAVSHRPSKLYRVKQPR